MMIITITKVNNVWEISIKRERSEESEKDTPRRYDGAPEEWKRIAREKNRRCEMHIVEISRIER